MAQGWPRIVANVDAVQVPAGSRNQIGVAQDWTTAGLLWRSAISPKHAVPAAGDQRQARSITPAP